MSPWSEEKRSRAELIEEVRALGFPAIWGVTLEECDGCGHRDYLAVKDKPYEHLCPSCLGSFIDAEKKNNGEKGE